MKINYLSIILLLCIGFMGSLLHYQIKTTIYVDNREFVEEDPILSQTYVDHPPIEILNDGAFLGYSFPGNGSSNNPYIIEGYNITSTGFSAIRISSTNSYFIIRDCRINSEFLGIALDYVGPGTSKIFRNIIKSTTNDGGGITLRHLSNSTIEQNICYNFGQGIHVDEVNGCTIHNNIIRDASYQGINIRYSDSNLITNNHIINSKQHGIAIVGSSANNVIHHNKLEGNSWHNSYDIDGGPPQGPPTSQGYDEGSNNIWYNSESQEGNYWSDYFGIGSYFIDGSANAIDLFPYHTTGITPFVLIIILIPSSVVVSAFILLFLRKKRR
ncbi:MAG: hypothetical protein EU542_05580 [Promethearchaeota archaeon]|nr:MAG: hypothetical protein EU542_05580 [Candidatus Lokiarchaeota archaeon]